ncbi:MAG: TetM/TetW/TetO/TetS family tetracycline resistance ribosomal protection protein [Spirochaetes bacterium]|nr:TetM/TetW/TetO/TetS family tetracycline resistance ribosomal protection protein [Spirochaetota bacterium]HOV46864.1 TetM/TetW/TetO/TetS family tetracycline resistance ribosomal protection protein [Exilispira sp.]HPO60139.1 TetM/TetW/TetO/TetS family tetracycline resistance ribosomal protection protein [Exilispira sp.]
MSPSDEQNQLTIGIIAHIDAGKTTTTENILYQTGKIHKIGSVDDGTTEMDYLDEEKERGITIISAATTVFWKNHKINIIDTPGHIDFISEVKKSLTVIDSGILVVCGTAGVQAQTETLYNLCSEDNIPLMFFINKLDRPTSSFSRTYNSLVESFKIKFLPINLPIYNLNDQFTGVYDILIGKAFIYNFDPGNNNINKIKQNASSENDAEFFTMNIDDYFQQKYKIPDFLSFNNIFSETLAEFDESFLHEFLSSGNIDDISYEKKIELIKSLTKERKLFPVSCGSALKKIGISQLLDNITLYLPTTDEVKYTLYSASNEPIEQPNKKVAFVFKTIYEKQSGKISFLRIYNGNFNKGDKLFNPRINEWERISHIYQLHANKKTEIQTAHKGDIVGIIGFKDTQTGDTLLSDKSYIFMHKHFLTEPVITMSIEPRFVKDVEPLLNALEIISNEDNSFRFKQNQQSGLIEVSGMGELHLQVIQHRLFNEFKIETRLGNPSIAYKETITQRVSREISVSKIVKGVTNHFEIGITLEPSDENKLVILEKNIEPDYLSFFEIFSNSIFVSGPMYGYPITNLSIILDRFNLISNSVELLLLGEVTRDLFFQLYNEAKPALLEPIMKLDIVADESHFSEVISDLNAKNVDIIEMKVLPDSPKYRRIIALGRLSLFFGYSTILRNLTSGQGYFSMEFYTYQPSSI